jgi:hypothetical protein
MLGALVTVGPFPLFSTDTADAWLLDPEDHLAARLPRDGDPEDIHFEETGTRLAIGWKGNYRIQGDAFVYIDKDSGRVVINFGYPSANSRRGVDRKISNIFGKILHDL